MGVAHPREEASARSPLIGGFKNPLPKTFQKAAARVEGCRGTFVFVAAARRRAKQESKLCARRGTLAFRKRESLHCSRIHAAEFFFGTIPRERRHNEHSKSAHPSKFGAREKFFCTLPAANGPKEQSRWVLPRWRETGGFLRVEPLSPRR
jgi:hypothetical protein